MTTVSFVRTRWLAPALLTCLAACGGGGSSSGGSDGDISLTGSWGGPIQVTLAGAPTTAQFEAQMLHSGSAITGTVSLHSPGDPAEPATLTGEVLGGVATLVHTPVQVVQDDCHLYPITLVFAVSQNVLTLTSASGFSCDGNGTGGHLPLEVVGGGSGTVTRQ